MWWRKPKKDIIKKIWKLVDGKWRVISFNEPEYELATTSTEKRIERIGETGRRTLKKYLMNYCNLNQIFKDLRNSCVTLTVNQTNEISLPLFYISDLFYITDLLGLHIFRNPFISFGCKLDTSKCIWLYSSKDHNLKVFVIVSIKETRL